MGDINHKWFGKIMHFKNIKKIPNAIMNLFILIIMTLWVLVGMCIFGITWTMQVQRNIFDATKGIASDNITEEDNESDVEIEKTREENKVLEERNSKMNEEDKVLRNMVGAFQNKS